MDSDKYLYTDEYPCAFGGPCGEGRIREKPEDFKVYEQLGYGLTGEGNHLWLLVEKTNSNTDWLAQQLARFAKVAPVAIGYAGLKDRHATTRQWFSVDLSGKPEPDWALFEDAHPQLKIIDKQRHGKKLKRGGLHSNRFEVTVRHGPLDRVCLENRIQQIADRGVPNYFGPQRFGRDGQNVINALRQLAQKRRKIDRHKRSIYISALRSFLFNWVLAKRVSDQTWLRALPGDVMMLDGTSSIFCPSPAETGLQQRLDEGDIHLTGPLWGTGERLSQDGVGELEQSLAEEMPEATSILENIRNLEQERRSLRLMVKNLEVELNDDKTLLRFELERGAFATSVLRELFSLHSC